METPHKRFRDQCQYPSSSEY